jgi:hypothetical protein
MPLRYSQQIVVEACRKLFPYFFVSKMNHAFFFICPKTGFFSPGRLRKLFSVQVGRRA